MIDSIDYIVRLDKKLDFKRLRKMGIKITRFKYINHKNGYINYYYYFKYNNIGFKWNSNIRILTIFTNVHTILNKQDILLSDKQLYEFKVKNITNEILGGNNYILELNRIDYCVDIKLNKLEIQTYLNLMNSNIGKYCYMKKDKTYKTSIYYKTKYGKTNLNFYDKYAEIGLEKYKDIFRFEIQNKNRLIKSEFKKFGIAKDLNNYWCREAMQIYYFDLLKNFLHTGNYYQLEDAYKIINANYIGSMRSKLKKFLRDMVRYWGLSYLSNSSDPTIIKLGYTKDKIKNYCEKLDEIGVNPIPLQKWTGVTENMLPSLYNRLVETAEDKYFK